MQLQRCEHWNAAESYRPYLSGWPARATGPPRMLLRAVRRSLLLRPCSFAARLSIMSAPSAAASGASAAPARAAPRPAAASPVLQLSYEAAAASAAAADAYESALRHSEGRSPHEG